MRLVVTVALCAISVVVAACSENANEDKQPEQAAATTLLKGQRGVSEKLCTVLNELAPQAPRLSVIGTQAQLVMAIASAFDANAEALRQVTSDIDTVAAASCPAARDALLKVLKMNSLQEAVR